MDQLGMSQKKTNAPATKERVAILDSLHEARHFIAAYVQQADGDRAFAQRFQNAQQLGEQLITIRRTIPPKVKLFESKKSYSVRPILRRRLRSFMASNVSHDRHHRTTQRLRRLMAKHATKSDTF